MADMPGAVTDTTGVVREALDVRTIDCCRNRCDGSCSWLVGEGEPGMTTLRFDLLGDAPLAPPFVTGELQPARLDGDAGRWYPLEVTPFMSRSAPPEELGRGLTLG